MAAQTLTDVTRNYDDSAISPLLNGETITLNNSNLIINSDSRWGQQAAVLGAITISTTLGGAITLDGRDVWWIPFDASSGVVPSLGTAGVNDCTGSIAGTGEFLGVFPTTMLAPLTAGAAMPSSGFIKLRKKTISFVDNEVITFTGGATVTVNSSTGGQRGWIHVVGTELQTITVPRLGKFTSIGDYFQLGVTNGSDDQTFQFPIADVCPAVEIETAVGSGVYEWWLNAGDRWATATQFVATDERGKFFGMNNTTGIITIAQRASNSCGYKPITGLRVRIPNMIISSSNSTNWSLNTINATAATRYDFTTTSGGEIDIQHLCGNWHISCTSAFYVSVKRSALLTVLFSNLATKCYIDSLAIGLQAATDSTQSVSLSSLFSGLDFRNSRLVKYSSVGASNTVGIISDAIDVTLENLSIESFGSASTDRGTGSAKSITIVRCSNIIVTNVSSICGTLSFQACSSVVVTGYSFCDKLNGTTSNISGSYAIETVASCSNILIDGYTPKFPMVADTHPYFGIAIITASNHIEVRNVGMPTAKINGGSANQMAIFVIATTSTDLAFRRCYFENLRTFPFTINNTNQRITIENVWGDSTDVQAISALDVTPKGGMWTPSAAVQTAVYGRHIEDSFLSATNGLITCMGNEPLISTASQCAITAGTPKFNSSGAIQMPTVGDQVTWTMPYFALGHTELGGNYLTRIIGILPQNLDYDYQIDTGAGFSAWKQLMTARNKGGSGGAVGTNWTTIVAVAESRQPQIGDYVGTIGTSSQNFLPVGTTVINIVGTTITFSNNFTSSNTTMFFFWNAIETEAAFSAATGAKLKVRATTMLAAATNAVSYINIDTKTDSVSQQIQYPLPVTQNEGKVSGIEVGSRIRVYNVTTATEIANEVMATTDWTILYDEGAEFTDEDVIEIRIAKTGYLPNSFFALATATGWAALAGQQIDAVYSLNGIDGSTVTELTGDFPNVQIDSSDADGETTVQRIYAWFSYVQTTEQGIRDFFEAMLAEDEVNYRVRVTVANLKLDNTIATPLMIIGGRLYRDDGATVIAATSNSIQLDPSKAYAIEVGTSGLTPTEAATLAILDTLTEDVSGMRFTTKALEQAPSGGGSLTAADVWTYSPRTITSAAIVRTELATELARIDVATSTRNAVAPDNASVTAIKAKTDNLPADPASNTQVNTRLATASYTAPDNASIVLIKAKTDNLPTDPADNSDVLAAISAIPSAPSASTVASAVRTELSTELARVDVAISTRNAVAPDNTSILAIKAKTDNLPVDPADNSDILAAISAIPSAPSAATVASAVRTELTTELARVDVATSTRNAVAPDNAGITAIKAKTDNLPVDPADNSDILAAISTIPAAPTAASVAGAVRTELTTELGRIDVAVSTRNAVAPDNASVTAIKAKTDNLPADPASETSVNALPTLAEVEGSTVLAKESTSQEIKSTTKLIPAAL